MAPPMDARYGAEPYVIYLCPLVWRPLQVNFARRFERLSAKCSGSIFMMSGARQRGMAIERFRVYAEPDTGWTKYVRRFWVQVVLPVLLLWNRRAQRNVVVSYDAYLSGLAGVLLKIVLGTRLVVEINGDDQNQHVREHSWMRTVAMSTLFRFVLTMADAVKVVNSHQEAFIQRNFPRKRVFRYPDFAATEYFSGLSRTNGEYLLSIGHPFHLKGVDIVIRAFQDIVSKYPTLKLRIMGYAEVAELAHYKALAREDPRIEFVKPGWVEDVGEQLRACYAYISASRREAASRLVFEAMACAKPIVSSRTNSGSDYVRDGETGLLFDIGDSKDLAAKLDWLLTDRERARTMGEAGCGWIKREFSEPVYIERFHTMIQEVLA